MDETTKTPDDQTNAVPSQDDTAAAAPDVSTEGREADSSPLPGFLTREEYEQVGDDPDPLPRGFEVIDGTGTMPSVNPERAQAAASAPHAGDEDTSAADPQAEQPGEPAPAEQSAAQAVGAFLSAGADAVRQVSAAKRAHDTARGELEELDRSIAAHEEELDHRRDIANRYQQIVEDETARQDAALAAASEARTRQDAVRAQITQLKERLQQAKEEDAQTEKRYRAAVDAAEAKELSSRESGSRLQRRLDDAKKNLTQAENEKTSGIQTAQQAVESANARLDTLRDEFVEVQRNPSANSAAYSVRTTELQNEIADATDELRRAKAELPRIQAEVERNLTSARAMVAEAQKPIDDAKKAFRAVTAEADKARDELDRVRREASARQRELRDQIADQEKAAREQEKRAEEAQAEADDARAALDEATDIHEHPEVTEGLNAHLEELHRRRDEKLGQVEHLAATEQDIRERTRGSRYQFIAAVAGAIALVVVIAIAWVALSPK